MSGTGVLVLLTRAHSHEQYHKFRIIKAILTDAHERSTVTTPESQLNMPWEL